MSNSDPQRWKQRLENYLKALDRLRDACVQEDYSELERAGLIQFFEMTFELFWKTLKDYLYVEGIDAKSPRAAIRGGFSSALLSEEDTEAFLEALSKRNIFAHIYDEKTAKESAEFIKNRFLPAFERVRETLERRVEK